MACLHTSSFLQCRSQWESSILILFRCARLLESLAYKYRDQVTIGCHGTQVFRDIPSEKTYLCCVEEWKSGSVEMWKCGSVEVWKSGSVEGWKCGPQGICEAEPHQRSRLAFPIPNLPGSAAFNNILPKLDEMLKFWSIFF